MLWFKALGAAARCFFDWPLLWTRLLCVGSVAASFVLLYRIQILDHDNSIQKSLAESCYWIILWVVISYSNKNAAEVLLQVIAARFGVKLPETPEKPKNTSPLPSAEK